jgi:signal peptide peptidase SppA
VVLERRARLDFAAQAPARAIECSGVDHPDEAKRAQSGKAVRAVKGKVGAIQILGPVEQRYTSNMAKTGGTSTEEVGIALDALLADNSVGAIVLDIDSPGGSSYGTEELSDKIYNAREQKPIYAIANSMAASAGYWIASAAEFLAVTPGGDVGSVGVYAIHVDESKALEKEGISVTAIHAGKFKVEGAPWAPLTEEARTHFQESVNVTYSKFLGALKRNRGTTLENVRENYGQGRLLNADDAVAAGMADRAMTIDDLFSKLLGGGQSGQKKASAEVLRLRHEHEKARAG